MFETLIVSSDEYFKGFFPIVAKSWRKFFPEIELCAAFVTTRPESDEEVEKLRDIYDKVVIYKPVDGIPTKNVAKMARFLLASTMQNKVCSIEDVDTIPLQKEYFADKISLRKSKCSKNFKNDTFLKFYQNLVVTFNLTLIEQINK